MRSAFSIALIANAIPVISVLYIAEKTLVVDFFFDIQALYRVVVAVEVALEGLRRAGADRGCARYATATRARASAASKKACAEKAPKNRLILAARDGFANPNQLIEASSGVEERF